MVRQGGCREGCTQGGVVGRGVPRVYIPGCISQGVTPLAQPSLWPSLPSVPAFSLCLSLSSPSGLFSVRSLLGVSGRSKGVSGRSKGVSGRSIRLRQEPPRGLLDLRTASPSSRPSTRSYPVPSDLSSVLSQLISEAKVSELSELNRKDEKRLPRRPCPDSQRRTEPRRCF